MELTFRSAPGERRVNESGDSDAGLGARPLCPLCLYCASRADTHIKAALTYSDFSSQSDGTAQPYPDAHPDSDSYKHTYIHLDTDTDLNPTADPNSHTPADRDTKQPAKPDRCATNSDSGDCAQQRDLCSWGTSRELLSED